MSDYRILVPSVALAEGGLRAAGDGLREEDPEDRRQRGTAARANFLIRGMLQEGARRCIAYCGSKRECADLSAFFVRACELYFGVGATAATITCDTRDAEREAVLARFQSSPAFLTKVVADEDNPDETNTVGMRVLHLVTSVRILDEAIDVPACDSVFFANAPRGGGSSSSSTARSVQRMCRALRVYPGKERASVFVWTGGDCYDSPDDAEQEPEVLAMFSKLREFDPEFGGRVRVVGGSYDAKGVAEQREADVATLRDVIERYVMGAMTPEQRWSDRLEGMKRFAAVNNGRLPKKSESFEGHQTGAWCGRQRQFKKKGVLGADRVAQLEAVPGWRWGAAGPVEDPFPAKLERLQRFVADNNGRLPKRLDIYEGQATGSWCKTQRQLKKKGVLGADRVAQLEAVPGWRWEAEAPWPDSLERLQRFVADNNGRLPTATENYEGQKTGTWCHYQRQFKKKGVLCADRVTQLEAVPGWRWEAEDPWPANLERLKRFVADNNGRLPKKNECSEGHQTGAWCGRQRKFKKKGVLRADRVAQLEAVPGWRW